MQLDAVCVHACVHIAAHSICTSPCAHACRQGIIVTCPVHGKPIVLRKLKQVNEKDM